MRRLEHGRLDRRLHAGELGTERGRNLEIILCKKQIGLEH